MIPDRDQSQRCGRINRLTPHRPDKIAAILGMCCAVVASPGRARADYLGLATVVKSAVPDDPTGACSASPGVDVCNLYAVFDGPYPANKLLSVGNAAIAASSSGGLYQHIAGTDLAPLALLIPGNPELLCDSFVTIGLKVNDANSGGNDTAVDPSFSSPCFNNQDDAESGCTAGQVVGGWYNSDPFNTQGHPVDQGDGTFSVLLAQLSIDAGAHISGALSVFAKIDGTTMFFNDQGFQCPQCEVDADCDDGNPCTVDTCDAAMGCEHEPVPVACDDGDACTIADTCVGGHCVGGRPLDCDDGDLCTVDDCDPSTGDCLHAAVNCDDGNPCTDDSCDSGSGCEHDPNTAACDDGDACTLEDGCIEGACVGGSLMDCDDGVACTLDGCIDGSCLHTPVDTACNNGLFCDGAEVCELDRGCVQSKPACGEFGCDEKRDVCLQCARDEECDDGNPRTVDHCITGLCENTTTSCWSGAGDCFVANGTPGCDDLHCCQTVCAVDAFCCDVQWDSICADSAIELCTDHPSDCGNEATGICDAQVGITGSLQQHCNSGNWVSLAFPFETVGRTFNSVRITHFSNEGTGHLWVVGGDCNGPDVSDVFVQACDIIQGSPSGIPVDYCVGDFKTHDFGRTWVVLVFFGTPSFDVMYDSSTLGTLRSAYANLDGNPDPRLWQDLNAFGYGASYCVELVKSSQCQDPVCGNGIREFGEQCDGADDQACVGLCDSDCTCPPPATCGPGAGDCFEANGSPGCEDIECCGKVCGTDPHPCCTTNWNANCAQQAQRVCAGGVDCGDDVCNGSETCEDCPADCGPCPTGCGNQAPEDVDEQVGISGGFLQTCNSGSWVSLAYPIHTAGGLFNAVSVVHNSNDGAGDIYLCGGNCDGPDVEHVLAMQCDAIVDQPSQVEVQYCFDDFETSAEEPTWVILVPRTGMAFDVMYDSDTLGTSGSAYGNLDGGGAANLWQDLDSFGLGAAYAVKIERRACRQADCDDGDFCTLDELVDGACIHEVVDCDDKNECTICMCDPALGCVCEKPRGSDCAGAADCPAGLVCVECHCVLEDAGDEDDDDDDHGDDDDDDEVGQGHDDDAGRAMLDAPGDD